MYIKRPPHPSVASGNVQIASSQIANASPGTIVLSALPEKITVSNDHYGFTITGKLLPVQWSGTIYPGVDVLVVCPPLLKEIKFSVCDHVSPELKVISPGVAQCARCQTMLVVDKTGIPTPLTTSAP